MYNEINIDELQSNTPEEIAFKLFNNDPKPACNYQIIAEEAQSDLTYIFEILVIILMEGLEILIGNLENADIDKLEEEHFTSLNPWFQSIGFKIKSGKYTTEEKELCDKYYCNILVKNTGNNIIFLAKQINKNYHFLLNGVCLNKYDNETDLKKIYGVIKTSNYIHKISFEFFYPNITSNFNNTNNNFLQTEQY